MFNHAHCRRTSTRRLRILGTKAVYQVPSTMKQGQRSWTEEARESLGRSISIENPSLALVDKCMAAATYGLNFDIAEIWRFLPDSGGHNLGGNKGIGSGSTLYPTPEHVYAQPATLRIYTGRIAGIWNSSFEDSQAPKKHVLSPSLCIQARASGCPLWFVSSESEKLHPSLPLNTAVVLPVPLEGDSTGNQEGSYVAVFLSLKAHERNMLSLQFLENISKAAARLLMDQRKVKERLESISEAEPVLTTLPDVPVFQLGERINMDVKRAELSQLNFLVSGSRCTIYTAVYRGQKVVVKSARTDVQDASTVQHELELEMQLLQRIRHKNVMALLGIGTELGLFLILERMENGSLAERLKDDVEGRGMRGRPPTKPFTYMELLRRGRQLAEALRYLHEEAIPGHMVVHRDLKPDNVGFTAEGDLKVLDLGLGRVVVKSDMENATYEMTGNTGSERYMAPEVAESFEYNEKVDVYSFGLVLWTMYTLRKPFAGMGRDEFKEKVVRVGVRPALSKKWPRPLADLMRACWAMKMEERPSFVEVCVRLQDMLQQGIDKNLHGAEPRRGIISKFLKNRNSSWF